MIRHEQRGEFFFIYWRGLRFQEMKPNLVYLFVMDIPEDCFFCICSKVLNLCEWIADRVEGFRVEVVCRKKRT